MSFLSFVSSQSLSFLSFPNFYLLSRLFPTSSQPAGVISPVFSYFLLSFFSSRSFHSFSSIFFLLSFSLRPLNPFTFISYPCIPFFFTSSSFQLRLLTPPPPPPPPLPSKTSFSRPSTSLPPHPPNPRPSPAGN